MTYNWQPPWFVKAKQIAAKLKAAPEAKKKGEAVAIYIYDAIGQDPWTGEGVQPKDIIARLDEAKSEPIDVHVNSPGGFVFDGISIYNAIRNYAGPKTVYVDGIAASIASVIALAGDKVVTNDGAMWMVHDPMGGMLVFGTADEIEDAARKEVAALRKVRENLTDIYVGATGKTPAEVSDWMTGETWMTADEALARGFTDEVSHPEPVEEEPKPRKAAKVPRLPMDMRNAVQGLRRDAIVTRAASRFLVNTGPAPAK